MAVLLKLRLNTSYTRVEERGSIIQRALDRQRKLRRIVHIVHTSVHTLAHMAAVIYCAALVLWFFLRPVD